MKRFLSVASAVALLVVLGVAASIAGVPQEGGFALAPGRAAAAGLAGGRNAPASPSSSQNYNAIALPLDVQANWATAGYSFDAQGLAEYLGVSSVEQVLRLDATRQDFDSWFPGGGFGFVAGEYVSAPFALDVGGAYRILLNGSDPLLTRFSIVGGVPDQGAITFDLVGGATGCKYNELSVPLDQSALVDADDIADSMGGAADVDQVLRLNATTQDFDSWFPGGGFGFVAGEFVGTPFDVRIGYPYVVCLNDGADGVTWP